MRAAILSTALISILCACVPPNSVFETRALRSVSAGFEVDKNWDPLVEAAQEIDTLMTRLTGLLDRSGCGHSYSHTSYGLLPHTGHTSHLTCLVGAAAGERRSNVRGLAELSAKKFDFRFEAVEVAPQAGQFAPTEEDLRLVARLIPKVQEFAESSFPGRAVEVSTYANWQHKP